MDMSCYDPLWLLTPPPQHLLQQIFPFVEEALEKVDKVGNWAWGISNWPSVVNTNTNSARSFCCSTISWPLSDHASGASRP
jgi:hypothetical protein